MTFITRMGVIMGKKSSIAVAEGDGIGPEIMAATLHVLKEAGAELDIHKVEIGENVYLRGARTGIEPKTWDTIRHTDAFLKAPITTPQGGGFKSLNVTVRTTLGLYANVRPCVSYYPFVETKHPNMDVVIVRENEEDLYMGIEYRQTPDTYQALKVLTQKGSERIIRYAFDYAVANNRKKVTCFTKDNILKLSDGLFHKVFDEVAKEYPNIENEHWIIDIGTAKLADTPEIFDVIVLPNLYGDILSDVAAQITGSVGLAGSANIGLKGAMFEAIHGSAPKRAGQNVANPSGLMLASVMMLVHLGQPAVAGRIHNAWLSVIEEGTHTYDVYKEKSSKKLVGTKEFAEAVVKNLDKKPHTLKSADYSAASKQKHYVNNKKTAVKKELMGVDVFIQSEEGEEHLAKQVKKALPPGLQLTMISNRGVRVWPEKHPETICSDCWRCRVMSVEAGENVTHQQIASLLQNLAGQKIDFVQTQNLCWFDGKAAFTVAQEEQ